MSVSLLIKRSITQNGLSHKVAKLLQPISPVILLETKSLFSISNLLIKWTKITRLQLKTSNNSHYYQTEDGPHYQSSFSHILQPISSFRSVETGITNTQHISKELVTCLSRHQLLLLLSFYHQWTTLRLKVISMIMLRRMLIISLSKLLYSKLAVFSERDILHLSQMIKQGLALHNI